jgi:hypothetical protein
VGGKSSIIQTYKLFFNTDLLLCLGEFDLPDNDQQSLIESLLDVYRNDPDAGLHAASEWLLRKWDQSDALAGIDKELQSTEAQLRAAGAISVSKLTMQTGPLS